MPTMTAAPFDEGEPIISFLEELRLSRGKVLCRRRRLGHPAPLEDLIVGEPLRSETPVEIIEGAENLPVGPPRG